uniref:Uncharacterized protein n=1 Tax=Anguilla anguilla TaxID=7936 RepID=A0A0E9UPJ5_ANGAN
MPHVDLRASPSRSLRLKPAVPFLLIQPPHPPVPLDPGLCLT